MSRLHSHTVLNQHLNRGLRWMIENVCGTDEDLLLDATRSTGISLCIGVFNHRPVKTDWTEVQQWSTSSHAAVVTFSTLFHLIWWVTSFKLNIKDMSFGTELLLSSNIAQPLLLPSYQLRGSICLSFIFYQTVNRTLSVSIYWSSKKKKPLASGN